MCRAHCKKATVTELNASGIEPENYFFRKCYAKVNDRVELFELFCTFIRCGSEVETTHVQSSKRTPVLFPAIIFVLHAEICVSRCEGCASFGLFWSLDRPCSYLLSSPDRYIFFFFFLSCLLDSHECPLQLNTFACFARVFILNRAKSFTRRRLSSMGFFIVYK